MDTNKISDTLANNWKAVLGFIVAVLVVVAAAGALRERKHAREQAGANALYDAQTAARDFAAKKQYGEAEKVFGQVLDKFSGTRAAYEAELQIGDFWMEGKSFEQAAAHYEKAGSMAPDPFSRLLALYNLGIAQESGGKFKEAVATYENTLKVENADFLRPEVLMAQARCYEALNEKQKAIDLYKTVQEKFASRSYYSGAASAFEKQLASKKM